MDIDVFISYHTKSSKHITEAICNALESRKIKCWYAPRDTENEYASSIGEVIANCKIFLLVLNKESSYSFDCLNEINLACERIRNNEPISIIPFQVDNQDISMDAKYYLGRFHWIDALTPPLEKRILELADRIEFVLGEDKYKTNDKTSENSIKLKSSNVVSVKEFVGRDKEISKLEEELSTYGKCFLFGMGGIGKSEIAKKYAMIHKNEYETIIFAVYEKNLISTILDERFFYIEGFNRKTTENGMESDEEFFNRKLEEIKKIADEKTLIIIDNFDTEEDEKLKEFLDGKYNVIFTTRNNFKKLSLPIIEVKPLDNKKELLDLFDNYYEIPLKDEELEYVYQIFDYLEGHTLAIKLISTVMNESRIKPQKMLETLKKNGVSKEIKGEVSHLQKDYESVYNCISLVFDLSMLSDIDKKILKNLSFFPLSGVEFEDFMDLCEIEDGIEINSLIKKNIIKYEHKTDFISLHPLIQSVVNNELKPTLEDANVLIKNLSLKHTPFMSGSLKKYLPYIKSVYNIFPEFSLREADYFSKIAAIYGEENELSTAREIYFKILELYKNEKTIDAKKVCAIYRELEFLYYKELRCQEAIDMLLEGYEYIKNTDNYNIQFDYNSALSTIYAEMGNLDKANEHLDIAFEIYKDKTIDDIKGYFYLLTSKIKILTMLKKFDEALETAKECYKCKYTDDERIWTYCITSVEIMEGRVYLDKGEIDKAIEIFNKVIDTRKGLNLIDGSGIIRGQNSLTDAYIKKGEYKKALDVLLEMKEVLETTPMNDAIYKKVLEKIDICNKKLNNKED